MASHASRFFTRRHLDAFSRASAIASILVLIETTTAEAICDGRQFARFSPGPAELAFNAATIVSANDAWAVGVVSSENATATATLAEHWDGIHWSPVMTPSPGLGAGIDDSLNGVAAIAHNDVWAVGQSESTNGVPSALIEHWNGDSWSVIPSPTIGTTSSLSSITATSSSNVWAAGMYTDAQGTHALVEMWNGAGWSVVPDSDPVALTSISALSPNDVWATGRDVEQWNGTVWRVVSNVPASSISARGPDNIWIVENGKQIAHGNGRQWRVVAQTTAFLDAITAGPKQVWAVGQLDSEPFAEHWDGSMWTQPQIPRVGRSGNLVGVALLGTTALAVGVHSSGDRRELEGLKAVWSGSSWVVPKEPRVDTESNAFVAASSDASSDVWALDVVRLTGGFQATFEHWDGTKWSAARVPEKLFDVTEMASASSSDVWAVGEGFGGCTAQAMAAHWNGKSWLVVQPPICAGEYSLFHSVAAVNSNDTWAAGVDWEPGCELCGAYSFGILFHRVGKTWTEYDGNTYSLVSDFMSIRAVSASDVWAVGPTDFKHGVSTDYIYHWDGAQWSVQAVVSPEHVGYLNALAVVNANDIWAVGGQSHSIGGPTDAFILHYDGVSWTPIKHTAAPGGALTSVTASNDQDVWAAGGDYLAHWNGRTWYFLPSPSGHSITGVLTIPGSGRNGSTMEIGRRSSPYLNSFALDSIIDSCGGRH